MKPILFTIPWLERGVPGYGFMLMIGFLVSIMWAARRAARSGANPDVVLNCGFVALAAGVIGARGMYVIHYWERFKDRGSFIDIAWGIVDVSKGGLEHYGGLLLATVCLVIWLRWFEKVSLRWYMDIIAPSAALGLVFGRLGCLLNGCCWGGLCELPWAMRFPFASNAATQHWAWKLPEAELPPELVYAPPGGKLRPLSRESLIASDEQIEAAEQAERDVRAELAKKTAELSAAAGAVDKGRLERERERLALQLRIAAIKHGDIRVQMKKHNLSAAEIRALAASRSSLPVHPTQIYSAVTAFLIAMLLNAVYWRRARDGQVLCTMFICEPVLRCVIEVIRADNPVDTLAMFTISQFLAVCMVMIGVGGLLWLRGKAPRSVRARVWEPEEAERAAGKKSRGRRAGAKA